MYKQLAIHKYMDSIYAMKRERGVIDPFMIPFRDFVKTKIADEWN